MRRPASISRNSRKKDYPDIFGNSSNQGATPTIRKSANCSDPFHETVLSAYLDTIPVEGLPLDMAMRFLLLHLPLPKEQGSIYRLMELFSQKYHLSNPGLWDSRDQVLVVCYSILMLNTDTWNANNKVKMTREQYIKNTSGQGVSEDILSVLIPLSPAVFIPPLLSLFMSGVRRLTV